MTICWKPGARISPFLSLGAASRNLAKKVVA